MPRMDLYIKENKKAMMGKIVVQIYEIQEPAEAEQLLEIGVDHIGSVILNEKEWRSEKIKEVVSVCQGGGKKSSIIFLSHDMDAIQRAIEYYRPDIVHFCDNVSSGEIEGHVQRQAVLKESFPDIMIMRSIPVPLKGEPLPLPVGKIKEFESCTDIFLIDTYVSNAPVSGYIGITGKTCDWHMAKDIVKISSRPVILGGGLNPLNVYEAISMVRPYGVDSCSGTNATDKDGRPIRFRKDMDRVRRFVEECRRYEREKAVD